MLLRWPTERGLDHVAMGELGGTFEEQAATARCQGVCELTVQSGLAPELAVLDAEDDAIVVVNVEGTVVLMNVAAEKIFRVSGQDMVGEYHELLVPEGMQWGHQAYRRGYFAEPSARWMDPGLNPCAQRPDGTLVPIAVWLEPRRVDDVLFVVAHISERDQ